MKFIPLAAPEVLAIVLTGAAVVKTGHYVSILEAFGPDNTERKLLGTFHGLRSVCRRSRYWLTDYNRCRDINSKMGSLLGYNRDWDWNWDTTAVHCTTSRFAVSRLRYVRHGGY